MKFNYYLLAAALFLVSCKNNTGETTSSTEEVKTAVESVIAVCISNGVPVRAEASKGAKYISSLNLGETLVYLGDSKKDSTDGDKEYYHVELSDGTIAWARSYGVLIDGNPAAIITETPIYKRPDLVTKTNKNFYPLEFIAVVGEKEDWIEVIGAGKTKKGWIQASAITLQQEDVATATLASKDLLIDGKIVSEKIDVFLENLPYKNTQFIAYLQGLLNVEVEDAIVNAIEEYEEVENKIYD